MSATPRVRVELVRGQSSLGAWETDAKAAGARVEVGSDPDCAWRIVAAGVQPYHVEMYWDGEVLWVADSGERPTVKVDGMVIDDWCATAHGSRVEFGEASLRVVTQAADLSSVIDRTDHGMQNPTHATKATGIHGEKTQLDRDPLFADGDENPVYALETGVETRSPAADEQVVTRLGPAPKRRLDEVALTQTTREPIFGGAAAHPADTRLVPLPAAPSSDGVRRAPPPRLGARGRAVRASSPPNGAAAHQAGAAVASAHAQPPMSHAQPANAAHAMQPAPTPQAPLHAMHAIQPAPTSQAPPHAMHTMQPAPTPHAMPPSASPAPSHAGSPPDAHLAAPTSAFAPSPDSAAMQPGEAPAFTQPPAKTTVGKPKKAMSLPPRTWILLSITVLAACFVLLMDGGEEVVEDEPSEIVPVTVTEPAPTDEIDTAQVEAPPSLIARPELIEVAELEEPGATAEEDEAETGDTLAKRAADALMAGDHRAAMLLYRELVLLEPENEAYRSIAELIDREMRAHCRNGVDPNGEPCELP